MEKIHRDKAARAEKRERDLSRQAQGGELSSEQIGLVISRFNKQFEVEALEGADQGLVHRCSARANLEGIVAGDKVIWRAAAEQTGIIESRLPRKTILERPDNYGRIKPVAANIDQMLIVIAVQPSPQVKLIDRYLVAAELMGIRPILVLNKADLITAENEQMLLNLLRDYDALGYTTVQVISSRHQPAVLSKLPELVCGYTSIVVGQSGVGKSSLVNTLLPEANLAVGQLSESSGEGTHTTTQAKLLHLQHGGQLIDSPGIRDFGLWHIDVEQLQYGFKEIAAQVGLCRFRNCQHVSEPGCAVSEAVATGEISARRFGSFMEIRNSITGKNTPQPTSNTQS